MQLFELRKKPPPKKCIVLEQVKSPTFLSKVNFPMRLTGFNVFQQFVQAKKVVFLYFDVIKSLKMRVLLEIQLLLEGESY